MFLAAGLRCPRFSGKQCARKAHRRKEEDEEAFGNGGERGGSGAGTVRAVRLCVGQRRWCERRNDGGASASTSPSGEVSVYSREDGSGTRGAFIELFGIEEKDANGDKVDLTTPTAAITNARPS